MKFPDSSFALTRKHTHLIHSPMKSSATWQPGEDAALLSRNWRNDMRENLRRPLVTPALRGVHHLALCTDDMKATIDF
jgi:hypothetical protein